MDYILLKDFLATYSLPTLLIALVCAVVSFFINKLFYKKLPRIVIAYLPFILAIILYFAYHFIFVLGRFEFTESIFYAGILSGSLSVIIYKSAQKIASGKPLPLSSTALLIEGILQEYISENKIFETVISIEKLILSCTEDQSAKTQIAEKLRTCTNNLSVEEIDRLAQLLVSATKSLKKG